MTGISYFSNDKAPDLKAQKMQYQLYRPKDRVSDKRAIVTRDTVADLVTRLYAIGLDALSFSDIIMGCRPC